MTCSPDGRAAACADELPASTTTSGVKRSTSADIEAEVATYRDGRRRGYTGRPAVLGLRLIANDAELQAAIRHELIRNEPSVNGRGDERQRTLTSLRQKRRKLLDLHYTDRISADAFGEEEARLASQIDALALESERADRAIQERSELSARFEEVATLLRTLDIDALWDTATTPERRVLVEDLVDAVLIHPDRLVVQVSGAPPLLVTLAEVGLRDTGTRTSVSEGGLEPPRPCGH